MRREVTKKGEKNNIKLVSEVLVHYVNYSGDDTSLDFWIIVVDSGIRYLPQDVGSVLNTMFNFRKQVITQNNFALIFRDKEKKKGSDPSTVQFFLYFLSFINYRCF